MSPLLEAIFTYACEIQPRYTKKERQEYNQNTMIAERAQKGVNELLTEEGLHRFAEYTGAESKLQLLELQSLFRIGISIGLELSRLIS